MIRTHSISKSQPLGTLLDLALPMQYPVDTIPKMGMEMTESIVDVNMVQSRGLIGKEPDKHENSGPACKPLQSSYLSNTGEVKVLSTVISSDKIHAQRNDDNLYEVHNTLYDFNLSIGENIEGYKGYNCKDYESKTENFEGRLKQAVDVSPVFNKSKGKGKFSSSDMDISGHVHRTIINKDDDNLLGLPHSALKRLPTCYLRRKLLVLDINGLLADIVSPAPKEYKADIKIRQRAIFKRPYCSDFLKFCFQRFDVGIWSSRSKEIVERVTDYMLGDMKQELLFCWDLSSCTETGFRSLENKHKPLVFKELKKIWEKHDPNLPWEKGEYNESNTLLLDDSPYKALLNPPHTALFPYSYKFQDRSDNSLGFEGDLRVYLSGLAAAENVQSYVEQHAFGQSAITERSSSWEFYHRVIRAGCSSPTAV